MLLYLNSNKYTKMINPSLPFFTFRLFSSSFAYSCHAILCVRVCIHVNKNRYCAAADAKDNEVGLPFSKDVQIDRHAYVHDKRFRPCLRFGFPVLKGGKDVPRELMEFTRMPPPNKDLAEHGRRYQVEDGVMKTQHINTSGKEENIRRKMN